MKSKKKSSPEFYDLVEYGEAKVGAIVSIILAVFLIAAFILIMHHYPPK